MTLFRKYDHLERLGHSDVEGINIGTVHVFAKLDGTNASVWAEQMADGGYEVKCGSRNRVLSLEEDNAGFCAWVRDHENTRIMALALPNLIFYGEWLVPHTLKTYREDVWRRFWIFDVYDRVAERYLSFDEYRELLAEYEPQLIEPLCTIKDPSEDQLRQQVETNTYLITDGAGLGEGVVIKNYQWRNRHGRQPWAKVVRNAFKEDNRRAFGVPEKGGEFQVEVAIVEEFVTPHLVGKTHAKVLLEVANEAGIDTAEPNWQQRVEAEHRGKVIPQLLGRVFHDLITEEGWTFIKKHMKSHPSIDFKVLQSRTIARVKQLTGELFS